MHGTYGFTDDINWRHRHWYCVLCTPTLIKFKCSRMFFFYCLSSGNWEWSPVSDSWCRKCGSDFRREWKTSMFQSWRLWAYGLNQHTERLNVCCPLKCQGGVKSTLSILWLTISYPKTLNLSSVDQPGFTCTQVVWSFSVSVFFFLSSVEILFRSKTFLNSK